MVAGNRPGMADNPLQWPRVVVAPAEQTVNVGKSASVDGSDSYDYETSIAEYKSDFDGDGEDDYSEYSGPYGDGITTHVYEEAGILTVKLTVIDANEATQNNYDYEAFGKVYGSPTENVIQPFRFTARAFPAMQSCGRFRSTGSRCQGR